MQNLRSKPLPLKVAAIPALIDRLATLPTYEEAIARLMATMKKLRLANWFVLWLLYAMRKKLLIRVIFLTHSLTYKLILIFRNNLNVYH